MTEWRMLSGAKELSQALEANASDSAPASRQTEAALLSVSRRNNRRSRTGKWPEQLVSVQTRNGWQRYMRVGRDEQGTGLKRKPDEMHSTVSRFHQHRERLRGAKSRCLEQQVLISQAFFMVSQQVHYPGCH
jgi:hypothetical protein